MITRTKMLAPRLVWYLACLIILATYAGLMNLKGISTDEGIRMWILNGGQGFSPHATTHDPSWSEVLDAGRPYAYQPLYYLLLNTVLRLTQSHDVLLFRSVNLFFLGLCLLGLGALSQGWRHGPRLFLLGLFGFNAYLIMHVLQIREYIVGVAFYIWSTWLVLKLDTRRLEKPWADVAWFSAYGLLLAAGFYTQTWVVFPAMAQGIFLVLRKRAALARFYTLLALSYLTVLLLTRPYLETHQQRVDVGQWGTAGTPLWPQLSDGLHLVLGGHLANQSILGDTLTWCWPLAWILAIGLYRFRQRSPAIPTPDEADDARLSWLLLLSIGLSLGFQIIYFLKVDTLSVWPRYFIIHYFFATCLTALSFKFLHNLCLTMPPGSITRRIGGVATAAMSAVLIGSAVGQVDHYRRNPYLDTSMTRETDSRHLAAELARHLQSGDGLLAHDFIHEATLTFTRPFAEPVIKLAELDNRDLRDIRRFLIIHSAANTDERKKLAARMSALGFGEMTITTLNAPASAPPITDLVLLVFSRK